MTIDIAVIDYGMGNLRSVSKAVEHVAPEARVVVTSEAAVVDESDSIPMPVQSTEPADWS